MILISRIKSNCKLMIYVILTVFIFSYAYAAESTGSNYDMDTITLLQGGGALSSSNYSVQWTAFGEGIGSTSEGSSSEYSILSGQLYLLSLSPPGVKYVISDLTAKTDIFGSIIPPATWTRDNDPYFYWKLEVDPASIEGFSVSLDTLPDQTIDTSETSYQFEPDSIASGKHVFYVLPSTAVGVWQQESMLSFDLWVDTDAPLINNVEPAAGSVIANKYVSIGASVSDAYSGFDKLSSTLTLNGQGVSFDYDEKEQLVNYTPAGGLGEGKNTVLLNAVDKVGNSATKVWEFIIDTESPTGNILINGGQEVTYSPYVTINISVEEGVSGIKYIYISNDGIFDAELNNPYPYSPTITNWLLADPDVNGLKTVYVKFRDQAGNLSEAYKDQIELQLRTPNTRIISGPASTTEETVANFVYESSRPSCLFSHKLDGQDWSEWQAGDKASFSGLAAGGHHFYVKSGFDLNGDGKITIEEEDATPAQWAWNIKGEGAEEKKEKKTLFWRR